MIVEPLRFDGEWHTYVAGRSDANLYHELSWRDAAWEAYRIRSHYLVAREHTRGPIQGVLPLLVAGNSIRRYLTTGLFGSYGKILSDSAEAQAALLGAARDVAVREHAHFALIKSVGEEAMPPDWVRRDTSVIAVLPLASSPQAMWKGFRDKIRNAIRKAQSHAMTVRWGAEQVGEFYDVLAENMHRKGTPIYGPQIMRAILRAFGSTADILTLSHQGHVVSGALVMRHRRVVYVPFASSRPASFPMNPNNLLYWEILRRACLEGMQVLDFGRSESGASTLAFKLHWGAVQMPEPFYYNIVRGSTPQLDGRGGYVRWMSNLWRRLPRPVADLAGPPITRRYLI